MKTGATEYYQILLSLCKSEDIPLHIRYKQMREMLERVCREQMQDESLQITDLSARISFVAAKAGLTIAEQNRLHTFRLTSNAILNLEKAAEPDKFLRDLKTLAFFIRKIYSENIPQELYQILPKADATYIVAPPAVRTIRRMRVSFRHADDQYLYVASMETLSDELLRVRYNIPQINEEFAETCKLLWPFAQLNLLDAAEDEAGILTPSFIVLEPDYLLDISSLAECYKDYGNHPANYQLNKLQPSGNNAPKLLGNIANLFLDEWINTRDEVDYRTCMQKVFRRYPLELAACAELYDTKKEHEFFADCKRHFEHIRQTVTDTFGQPGYKLDKTDAVLEPSYICEALGLQGRLDYMQRDASAIIEMKSGKADEYAIRNKITPKENHRVQMLLYQAVLQYTLGKDHRDTTAYLFYTRYPLLYPARSSWALVRRAIDLRNRIVADEYAMQLHNNLEYTREMLSRINATTLNTLRLKGRFWEQYLSPSIDRVQQQLRDLTEPERAYFLALFNFNTKELYTSKSGDAAYEGRTGGASLWQSTFLEKHEAGEILYDLQLAENHADDVLMPRVIFNRNTPAGEPETLLSLPNFRHGDAVLFYKRNSRTDNVTYCMVIKGIIESLTEEKICVRLRASQHNTQVLPVDSRYAIEHDFMDTSFRTMFTGLSLFLDANRERRELLMGLRQPRFDETFDKDIASAADDFDRVALKALAARDYFLLIGPPGTGKTSRALRLMVETFHRQPNAQILLLAYTNRAVDEICKALSNISPAVDYIRLGNELSCEPLYREHLLENTLTGCSRRDEVRERIAACRIFVGTVATMSNKPELFKLKTFDVAIIDEATQILEPQLVGILSAKDDRGRNSVGKFILIGDHKQLPAVVLQSAAQTEITHEPLRNIGITNLRDSLFERLHRTITKTFGSDVGSRALDMLSRQGRMHPSIASFPNHAFYGSRLGSVGLPHQLETTSFPLTSDNAVRLTSRVVFIPTDSSKARGSGKVNHAEARTAARLAHTIYTNDCNDFDINTTLGIITPYRSQIALIKQEIARLGIDCLNDILVDTVERYQGSERDFIIYSFCANYSYQLNFLSNLIEEDGRLIDRKLNVALTRARKMMYILGTENVLNIHPVYSELLKFREKDQF